MRRNGRFGTKKKIIDCYVFSVLNYGCDSWTWNKAMLRKLMLLRCGVTGEC